MYTMIAVGMLAVGILMIVISLILMVVWRIPDLFDELTGKKAKRQINASRDANVGTGAFEGMSTNEITEMANQEYARIKSSKYLEEYNDNGTGLSDIEDADSDYTSREDSRSLVEDDDEDRVENDGVAEVKWVLVEEASSIFKQEDRK